jgi:gliding motility-associated-like protein
LRPAFEKQLLLVFICLLGTWLPTEAQVNSGFTADITGGCSPLTVRFTNTSSASSSAVYLWDFGNGNGSALKDPGAVFLEPKKYLVTLTVTDGNQTSNSSQTITVYKKPEVDFSSSLEKVCTPEPVPFTAKATADEGTIADYLWDFGDGYTEHSYSASVSHVYLTAQEPSVRLSVTDNHGCTNSKTINNIIKVFTGVKADFEADKTFICFQPDPVQMINKSEGEGPLKYTWDFGDGVSSTEKEPTHVFSKKGNYTVSLAIENPNGCKSSLVKTSYLNVGNFNSQLNVPDIICKNAQIEITNTSTPAPTSFTILVDGQILYPYYYGKYYYTFSTAGEHTIQLNNQFGECAETVTKKVEVKEPPSLKGFVTTMPKYCFPPVTVNFQDTTKGVVESKWYFFGNYQVGKNTSYDFSSSNNWPVTLFVTDSNGCSSNVQQQIIITQPHVIIQPTGDYNTNACLSLTKQFAMYDNEDVASFTWNFGDGTSSADLSPTHTFGPGDYNVTLTYTTKSGCTAQSNPLGIHVSKKPKADFTAVGSTTICGNSPVTLHPSANSTPFYSNWIINGSYSGVSSLSDFNYYFSDTGKYTVTLIQNDVTGCADTITKVDYIHVLPSFPQITQVSNTCNGDRGLITFQQDSRYATKWTWNFGDGSTETFTDNKQQVTHHYATSAQYNVTLTTSNGQCTNSTMAAAVVVIKQTPVLDATNSNLCMNDQFNFTISNLDPNKDYFYYNHVLLAAEYKDGTSVSLYNYLTGNLYYGTIYNPLQGKDSIRMIIQGYLNCTDTTNFVPIKIQGAIAGFEIITDNVCFHLPLTFKDTSSAQNTTITSRTWNFGDGQTLTTTKGGIVSHIYSNPGNYYVSLSITDASGCTSSTSYVSHIVTVNGPKAAFTTYGTDFHLNTAVQFYNNTNNFNSYNTQYQWDFGDGQTSTEFNPVNTYTKPGNYTIRLVAKKPDTGCGDTAFEKITVKNFNAYFSFTSSFVDQIHCSSLLVQFVNTSVDYTHIKWDFGDGFTSDNVNTPSHVYEKPGKYLVKLFVTGYNGLEKTYLDSVFVRDNKVNISADMVRTCTAQSVTLSALSKNAASYLWDFGDGTLAQASDTFSVHYYKTPGNYVPKLIAKDADGCASSVELTNKISIDSLNVTLKSIPQICAPKEVQFNPVITNIGSGQGDQPLLLYHWDFGTGNQKDTANVESPLFTYRSPGNYKVTLQIQSPAGCKKQTDMEIVALQGLGGQINGPSDICEQSTAQFSGTTLLPGAPSWKWIFEDGTVVNQEDPPARTYNQPGSFMVKLVVDNSGCVDTVSKLLQVHSKPIVTLSAKNTAICEGASFPISVEGADTYAWSPSAGLNTTSGAAVIASPVSNTNYTVYASNVYGCSDKDSVSINVIHPFTLQLAKEVAICSGANTRLEASGGTGYQWINNTQGLDNISVSDPVASPLNTTTYTVVASGEKQCFSDTAAIKVVVNPAPVVRLGNYTTVCQGQLITLNAFNSNAVYSWQDGSTSSSFVVKNAGEYHVKVGINNCTASDTIMIHQTTIPYFTLGKDTSICEGGQYILQPSVSIAGSFLWQDGSNGASLVVTKEGIYSLTASNQCGTYTDSILISAGFCNILMPTGFTPNGDGLNDIFRVKYPFAVKSFHLLIYNRWGEKVFETNNIREGWDGYWKGELSLQGIYVWVISFTGTNNKAQQLKGTVTLIR